MAGGVFGQSGVFLGGRGWLWAVGGGFGRPGMALGSRRWLWAARGGFRRPGVFLGGRGGAMLPALGGRCGGGGSGVCPALADLLLLLELCQ